MARTEFHHGRTEERRMQLDAVIEIFLGMSALRTYEEEHGGGRAPPAPRDQRLGRSRSCHVTRSTRGHGTRKRASG